MTAASFLYVENIVQTNFHRFGLIRHYQTLSKESKVGPVVENYVLK